jgi:hypothetical protein
VSKKISGASDIKSHPFFASISWSDVQSKRTPPPLVPQTTRNSLAQLDPAQFDTSNFEAVQTLVANLKRSKFHGWTYVNIDSQSK